MTTTTSTRTRGGLRTALLAGGGLALLWAVLAAASDGTTFHLAPVLVAGAPALLHAAEADRATAGRIFGLAAGGVLATLGVAAALSATGNLAGPSLLPTGGAALEAVVFAGLGGLAGLSAALWKRSPLRM